MLFPRRSKPRLLERSSAQTTLFCDAALSFHGAARGGSTKVVQPLSITALTLFMTIVAGVLTLFVVRGEYSRKESVSGFLEPVGGVIRIFPQRGGVISAVLVHEGQSVAQGELLFKVEVPQTMADGSDADGKLLAGLDIEQDALTRTRERALQRAETSRIALAAQVVALHRQRAELKRLADLQFAQRSLADQQRRALQKLHERGAIPAMQWLAARSQYLATEEKQQTTRELVGRLNGELAALESHVADQRYESADRIAALDAQLLTLQRARLQITTQRDFAARSPIAGRVMTLQRKVGELASPAQLVLTIIPDDSRLVGRLLIPTRAIGFVTAGQRVRLRFDAFPYQHFGTHPGVLDTVAASVLFNGDSYGPLVVNQPGYPATVSIPDQSITTAGRAMPLQPGMLLQADIILERRTLLEWLAEPLLGLRGRN